MARSPQEVVEWIGVHYVGRRDRSDEPEAREAFERMAEINSAMFSEIPVSVVFQPEDPYDGYQEMAESVERTGELRVFDGGEPHPIWNHAEEVRSRAVHDWYGHLNLDVDFSPVGEYRKWEHARNHYPAYCDRYLFTEVIAQLGAVHYLDDGFESDRFEQKVFPAPVEWIEEMARAVEEVEQ